MRLTIFSDFLFLFRNQELEYTLWMSTNSSKYHQIRKKRHNLRKPRSEISLDHKKKPNFIGPQMLNHMSNSHSSTPQIKQLSTQDLRKVKHIIKLINRRNKEKNHCEKEKKPTCWRRLERSWKSCASDFPSSAIFWISSISLSLSLCFLQYNLFFFFGKPQI